MARKKADKKIEVKTYDHKGAKRKNIPPVGLGREKRVMVFLGSGYCWRFECQR